MHGIASNEITTLAIQTRYRLLYSPLTSFFSLYLKSIYFTNLKSYSLYGFQLRIFIGLKNKTLHFILIIGKVNICIEAKQEVKYYET